MAPVPHDPGITESHFCERQLVARWPALGDHWQTLPVGEARRKNPRVMLSV
jgi:hypothetical protein